MAGPQEFQVKLAYCYIRAAPGLLHPVISRAEASRRKNTKRPSHQVRKEKRRPMGDLSPKGNEDLVPGKGNPD